MRYFGIFTIVMLLSFPAFAGMTHEEHCEKLGEVAREASEMRISGADKETTTTALIEMYGQAGSGVTADNVRGQVMVAYMAKMKPEKMRDYVSDQCTKDILK